MMAHCLGSTSYLIELQCRVKLDACQRYSNATLDLLERDCNIEQDASIFELGHEKEERERDADKDGG